MCDVDWNAVWEAELHSTSRRFLDDGSFWDDRVEGVRGNVSFGREMLDWQLSILDCDGDWKCLDIGCGCGRLSIPLSKQCRSVTCLDPSEKMLSCLRHEAETMGATNIEVVNSYWQDYRPTSCYDMSFASFSVFMHELPKQLMRMSEISDRVVIFASDELRVPLEVQRGLFGKEVTKHTDVEMIEGVAEQCGLNPVTVRRSFERATRVRSVEETAEALGPMFDMDASDPKLISYIAEHDLTKTDGMKRIGAVMWEC